MNVQLKRFLVSGLAVVLVVLVGLAGCSVVAPSRAPEATYDFGPQAASGSITRIRMDKAVTVHEVAAPAWLDVPAMHYRLAYSSPSQPRNFANSRWVMSPAALFTQRLKGRFAEASRGVYAPVDGVRTDLVLRVELEEFSQVFDSATAAHGLVRARASLVTPPAATAASISAREAPLQRTFTIQRPATTADADGGARALIEASDEAIRQILEWVAAGGKLD